MRVRAVEPNLSRSCATRLGAGCAILLQHRLKLGERCCAAGGDEEESKR